MTMKQNMSANWQTSMLCKDRADSLYHRQNWRNLLRWKMMAVGDRGWRRVATVGEQAIEHGPQVAFEVLGRPAEERIANESR